MSSTVTVPGPERFVNFSFRSVHFVRMKLQFSSITYSPAIEHRDRSVRLVEFDQKVHELFRPCTVPVTTSTAHLRLLNSSVVSVTHGRYIESVLPLSVALVEELLHDERHPATVDVQRSGRSAQVRTVHHTLQHLRSEVTLGSEEVTQGHIGVRQGQDLRSEVTLGSEKVGVTHGGHWGHTRVSVLICQWVFHSKNYLLKAKDLGPISSESGLI